ncbi:hypothetical protein [Maricaulis sp. CAU 1757]
MRGWRPRFETVGSIAAIVVGIAALVIGWEEARNSRAIRLANALPILQTGIGVSGDDEHGHVTVHLNNAGEGTALIRSAALVRGDAVLADRDALDAFFGPELALVDASLTLNRVELAPLPPGGSMRALRLSWARDEDSSAALADLFLQLAAGSARLDVCFCDVYERCWETRADDFPASVNECPAPTGFPLQFAAAPVAGAGDLP